jgi:hypothetical protein
LIRPVWEFPMTADFSQCKRRISNRFVPEFCKLCPSFRLLSQNFHESLHCRESIQRAGFSLFQFQSTSWHQSMGNPPASFPRADRVQEERSGATQRERRAPQQERARGAHQTGGGRKRRLIVRPCESGRPLRGSAQARCGCSHRGRIQYRLARRGRRRFRQRCRVPSAPETRRV